MDRNKKSTSLYWIKLKLRYLLANDDGYMEKYLSELDVIDRLLAKSVLKEMHCAKYVSLLTLAEKIHQSTDEIFYKTSCPCVLRPNSIIINAWEIFIAVVLLILAFFYPYYVAYVRTTDGWYITLLIFVTILWAFDIYVQCCTAIETYKGQVILDFQSILSAKVSDFFFILDVLAALPLEAIYYLAEGTLENSVIVLVQSNRLLKICRINNMFKVYENQITHDIVAVKYVKYTLYILIFIFWTGALYSILMHTMPLDDNNMYYNYMRDVGADTVLKQTILYLFFGVHILTTQGFYMPLKGSDSVFYLPISILVLVLLMLYVKCYGELITAHALKNYNKLMLQEYTTTVCFIMKQLKFPEDFQYSVLRYIDHQWVSNQGNKLLYPKTLIADAPAALYSILRYELMHDSFTRVPLFEDIPKEVELVYCNEFLRICIPPGQIMTYARQVSNQMYIITSGYCNVFGADGKLRKIIGPGDSFGVLETIMNVPMVHSVVTRTSCVLTSVSYATFKKATAADPEFRKELNEIIDSTEGWDQLEDKDEETVTPQITKEEKISFHNFGYAFGSNMAAYCAYHEPWDNLGYFNFLKYLTLRSTITTYGKFIHYWEIGRCIFAICSAILYSIPLVITCKQCSWLYILHFLDATAYIDLYVRHHVCYYTKEGVEVTHPKKTALNYWKTAFIIDLLGCVPFGRFLALFTKHPAVVFLRALHILQLHRLFEAYNYKTHNIRANVQFWFPLLSLIVMGLIVNYLSVLSTATHCDYGSDIPVSAFYTHGVVCSNSSYMTYSLFDKPLTPMRVYLYALWNMANIITASGIRGFTVMRVGFITMVTILSVIGYLIVEYFTIVTASVNLSRNVDLTIFQENTKSMLRYLKHKRVDVKLRRELVDHFEFIWRTRKGKRYEHSLSCFNSALNEDIMYNIFGKSMEESTVFENASPSFYRSLLAKSLHWMFIRRGIISRVNDVHGLIFFIHKGDVDVLGPDYSRLLVLPVGSYFGNLDDAPYGRHTLTMVARGHVECLVIYTRDFYRILKSYPRLYFHFKRLTTLNVDYIVGGPLHEVRRYNPQTASSKNIDDPDKSKGFLRRCLFGVRKRGRAIELAELLILVLACFAGFNLELYRIMLRDKSNAIIILLYFCDLLIIIKIYIRMHTSYENKKGILVSDKRKIIKHYSRQLVGFWLDVFTLVPFEFISAAMLHNINLLYRVWIYARCNRLFRIIFVMHYFVIMKKKVNVHIYMIRVVQLVVLLILMIQVTTMILLFVLCAYPNNNIKIGKPLDCDFDTIESGHKVHIYLGAISLTLSAISTLANGQLVPMANTVVFIYIIAMVLYRVVVNLFIAETCATLDIVTHHKTQYEYSIYEYKRHLEVKGVTPVLVEKTMRYLRLLWDKQKGVQWPVVLPGLPFYLREAVMNSMFGSHIRNHPVLKGCHVDLVRQMAEKMKTITFFYGDIIAFMGDIDESMYFIHEGEVNALSQNTRYREVVEHTLKAGEMFGLNQGLYPRVGHTYTYKAATVCFIVQLSRSKWIHLLDFFPASKELIFDEAKAKEYRES